MKAKANALLLCTLMIASALAGCAGEDVERTLTQADCDAIGDGYTLDSGNNACVTTETVTETVPETVTETVVETLVRGCTDSAANNHDSAAELDDGSCDYGRAQADIMADYAAGTIDFSQALYELEVSRKCPSQQLALFNRFVQQP